MSSGSENEKDEFVDVLYDPESDDKDTEWIGKQRAGRGSDAILSCPCCFATLCVDCQQHHTQQNRYRAMFVMNCTVKSEEKRYPRRLHKTKKSGGESKASKMGCREQEMFCAVCCEICDCEVAVYDQEGVYHFFNVLPSTA